MRTYCGPIVRDWLPHDLDRLLRDRLVPALRELPHGSQIRWWDRAIDPGTTVATGYVDVAVPELREAVHATRLWTINSPRGDGLPAGCGPLGLLVPTDLSGPDAWTVEALDEQLTYWVHDFTGRSDLTVLHDPRVLGITPPADAPQRSAALRAEYALRDRLLDALVDLPDGGQLRWCTDDDPGPWAPLSPEVQLYVPALGERLGTSRLWLAVDADRVAPLPRTPLALPVHRAFGSRRGLIGDDICEALEQWATKRTGRNDLLAMYDPGAFDRANSRRCRVDAAPVSSEPSHETSSSRPIADRAHSRLR